uniref:Uncharacterized protein n=1 Tax=Lates calcarifer TaxID=8187 RepID=A0A4W6DX78_LATCA
GRTNILKEDDSLPIHLKCGLKAALLYRAAVTLSVFGLSADLFAAAIPKKTQ